VPPAAPTRGLDPALLDSAERRAAALPRLTSLVVSRGSEILSERYYRGARRDRRVNIKSASKSVISALVGVAIAEGRIRGVEQPLAELLAPRYQAELAADPRKRAITVGDLLSMRAGLQPTSFENYGSWVTSRDWVRDALRRPLVAEPGGPMLYSTGSTHLLSAALTRATGMSTYAYARTRLFAPLGVDLRPWATDPQGIYFGGNEMLLTPREMLRFGELYLNGGRRGGRQVVPQAWVEATTRPVTRSPWSGEEYGHGWWVKQSGAHRAFFAWGYGGQYIFVVPDLALVMVTSSVADAATRSGTHLDAIHEILDRFVVPAAERGAGAAAPRPAPAPRPE
jgi:CubicO group peptidase (beta-lactamase class C family)